ncbi:HpcH/HpaI aldolase/citrate lyase family protein [Marinivivus vitaminiproducens]|uniref:HpcH/HpaI aldolase/citrate lyase family protein n=1 Tax=Marinivivus vitaminiproducens TaxID=3035935 RepID=UPI0027A87C71|nr:CoA ester lyase [Geminicoccaceae bacterium SCSIO 64248]
MITRPSRTWLFVPGQDERKMAKAHASAADALILDLEDAVAISEKPRARTIVRAFLEQESPERQIFVRVNDIQTGWTAEDLQAVCVRGLAGIILPKVEAAETIRTVSSLIATYERAAGLPEGQVRMNAIIETARGVIRIAEIAEAGGRLETLMFGAGDHTADLGIPTANVGPHITHAKIMTVLACRAAGLAAPIDTVFFDVTDREGFAADCEEAKALGFRGKAVIHPVQVDAANAAFTPSEDEVAYAGRVVDVFRDAERSGIGAVQLEGKLIDYAMLKTAEKTLATAKALAR